MTGRPCPKLQDLNREHSDKENNKVFVIMPFKDKYCDLFELGIKEIYSERMYDCKHVLLSHYKRGEYIICKICEEINSSSLIIADISESNANVYYELGMSHALEKKTLVIRSLDSISQNYSFIDFLKGISCNVITYENIEGIKRKLPENFNLIEKLPGLPENSDSIKEYKIACLVPPGSPLGSNSKKGFKFSEVFNLGIKKSLKKLSILKERGIDVDDISNIVSYIMESVVEELDKEKLVQKIKKVIDNISRTRYFIIDVTESKPEVFYWLGFIHGLGLNSKVDMLEDTTYLYIAQDKPENLPFDIRATRIIQYDSLTDLSSKISSEIERLEKGRINDNLLNKSKYKFWRHYDFRNTRFIFGSEFMFHPNETKELRNRISMLDFKTFNRLAYIMLFIEKQRELMYNIEFATLREFLNDNNELHSQKDLIINITDNTAKKLSKLIAGEDRNDVNHIIIIGSSCVNVATEVILDSLYGYDKRCHDESNKGYDGYIFITDSDYKLRSRFWAKPREGLNHSFGIYLCYSSEAISQYKCIDINNKDFELNKGFVLNKDDIQPYRKYYLAGKYRKVDDKIQQDVGLLIVFNNLNIGGTLINGQFIVLCGFSKYATYGLGRLISNYTIKTCQDIKSESEYIEKEEEKEEKIVWDQQEHLVDNFISVINSVINKNKEYCIEAVIEFNNTKDFDKNFCETTKTLKVFCNYNRKERKREDLGKRLNALKCRDSQNQ
jgi:hypothetical protein